MHTHFGRVLDDKVDCCGCSACFAVCPASAIVMRADEEGFLYPSIISEKCIGCQLCKNVCPSLSGKKRVKPTVEMAKLDNGKYY